MNHIQSPATGDQVIERAIVSAGANVAPRVTPADIEAAIVSEHYFTAEQGVFGARVDPIVRSGGAVTLADVPATECKTLELLTFCVLVLQNGFKVIGDSACVSPENFDAELGRKYAREKAISKMWEPMGYALMDKMTNA